MLYDVSAGHDQLILPASGGFCELVLAELHNSQLGGHLDSRRTLAALQLHVWWPGMCADMAAYVSSCPTCQHVKDSTQKQQDPLQSLAPPMEHFSSYTMDFIFGLPQAKGRDGVWRDGIMTVVDRTTKQKTLVAMHEGITAIEAADLFLLWVVRPFGVTQEIFLDRDP